MEEMVIAFLHGQIVVTEIKNEKTREKMNKKLDKVKSGFDHER